MTIAFLGLCILLASWSISTSLDKETGDYWYKVNEPSEETTDWKKNKTLLYLNRKKINSFLASV